MAFVTSLLVGAVIGAAGTWAYVRRGPQATETDATAAEQPVAESGVTSQEVAQAVKPTVVAGS